MNNNNKAFTMADLTSLSLNAGDQVDIVNNLKSKIFGGMDSDVLENLSPIVRKRVEVLREIQEEHDELEAKFFEERAALEAKYQALYQPLYRKRYEIVNGEAEVKGVVDERADSGDEKEKGVPFFWLKALINNEELAEEISESDVAAFKYLKDIKCSKMVDPKGFKLEFFFDTNPYFSNTVLTKSYLMVDEDADEPVLEKAIGTEIQWLPGRCLTQNTALSTETETSESFFNFFSPPEVPEANEKINIDEAEELQTLMEKDYDIGSIIREKIIPHAVSWFTGEAMEDGLGFEDEVMMRTRMIFIRMMKMKMMMKRWKKLGLKRSCHQLFRGMCRSVMVPASVLRSASSSRLFLQGMVGVIMMLMVVLFWGS